MGAVHDHAGLMPTPDYSKAGENRGPQRTFRRQVEDALPSDVARTAGVTAAIAAALAAVPPVSAFAVNGIYINTSGTNPATELGYGTWVAFGAGKVLVGFATGDPDFGTGGASVGAKTVAAAGSNAAEAAHTHATSVAAHASHTHQVTSNVSVADHEVEATDSVVKNVESVTNPAHEVSNPAVTSGGPSASLTHAMTNPAGSSHNHTFTGSATSVIQPSLVVYFWKRTA